MPNHHYIPKFFLNGFGDSNNQFYVYDKVRDVIKSKKFSPKSHFFEANRNSINIDGRLDHSPEAAYEISENTDKHIIKHLQQLTGVNNLTTEEMLRLQLFLHTLIFRLPTMDNIYYSFMRNVDYRLLGFTIKDAHGPMSDEKINMMKADEKFMRMYRPGIGAILFAKFQSNLDLQNWKLAFNRNETNLLGDNPFVFEDLNTINFFANRFVVPLTKRYKLIRTKSPLTGSSVSSAVSLLSDVMVIHQAKSFVCCSSKTHLQNMVNASKVLQNEDSRARLFNEL